MERRNAVSVEVIPSAKRLVSSLRDLGYDFVQSVADIVDNSVAAGATEIAIKFHAAGNDSWLSITDNGIGMSGAQINEAMRYGTEREYDDNELGRYGLGLKTASLAQCRRLTVKTRFGSADNPVEIRCLDMDHIERTDKWEILIGAVSGSSEQQPQPTGIGTVVIWEGLDRILGYNDPWGRVAMRSFFNLADQLKVHLGMVFHRFLSGDAGSRGSLFITVNDTEVEAWDPFAREESGTVEMTLKEYPVNGNNGVGIVRFRPFILPPKSKFSSEASFNRLAGPNKWNAQQGFYIYRANRMILSGGWCRMRALDEHTKLARVALDFFPDLDSAFGLNVAKARISLPKELRDKIGPDVRQLVRRAEEVYRSSPEATGGKPEPGRRGKNRVSRSRRLSGQAIGTAIQAAARAEGEQEPLKRIAARLRRNNPEVADELEW